uniref:BHLH domain-containing protein n=1 Tax=Leptobrachium leishanense TaxID=445787 RepID=A0A8C5PUL8_9ANUR
MSGDGSRYSEREFEALQPLFYPDDEEEEVSLRSPDSVPLGEDMWKKFELFPSPPTSPSQEWLFPGQVPAMYARLPIGRDPLDWASDLLLMCPETDLSDDEDPGVQRATETHLPPWNLESVIIQDCMWNGSSPKQNPDGTEKEEEAAGAPVSAPPRPAGAPSAMEEDPAMRCVDPTILFPFPVNNEKTSGASRSITPSSPGTSVTMTTAVPVRSRSPPRPDEEESEVAEEVHITVKKNPESSNKLVTSVRIAMRPKNAESTKINLMHGEGAPSHQQPYAAPSPSVTTEVGAPPPKKPKDEAPRPLASTMPRLVRSSSCQGNLMHGKGTPAQPQRHYEAPSPSVKGEVVAPLPKKPTDAAPHLLLRTMPRLVKSSSCQIIQMPENPAAQQQPYEALSPSVETKVVAPRPKEPKEEAPRQLMRIVPPQLKICNLQGDVILEISNPAPQQGPYAASSPTADVAQSAKRPKTKAAGSRGGGGGQRSALENCIFSILQQKILHNTLERQRRHDMRASFITLRNHVPGLVRQDNVPKVVILTKATNYIHSLNAEEQRLLEEKRALEKKRQQLLQEIEKARPG